MEKRRRYSSTAKILTIGSGSVLAAIGFGTVAAQYNTVYGVPFTYSGQQYYIREGSKRAVYPSREACMQDVPSSLQYQCEPVSNYHSGTGYIGRYYGPVYHPQDGSGYTPRSGYTGTEIASSSNVGKKLPSGASKHGFGSTGKAHTSSKGG
ncbi:MAG: hypothetical protein WAQ25_00040 [Candidatus Saccharimonas sp.]